MKLVVSPACPETVWFLFFFQNANMRCLGNSVFNFFLRGRCIEMKRRRAEMEYERDSDTRRGPTRVRVLAVVPAPIRCD